MVNLFFPACCRLGDAVSLDGCVGLIGGHSGLVVHAVLVRGLCGQ